MLLCPTGEHLIRQIAFCATLSLVGIKLFQFNLIHPVYRCLRQTLAYGSMDSGFWCSVVACIVQCLHFDLTDWLPLSSFFAFHRTPSTTPRWTHSWSSLWYQHLPYAPYRWVETHVYACTHTMCTHTMCTHTMRTHTMCTHTIHTYVHVYYVYYVTCTVRTYCARTSSIITVLTQWTAAGEWHHKTSTQVL